MKHLITFCLVLITSIALAQTTSNDQVSLISSDQKVELQTLLALVSEKLENNLALEISDKDKDLSNLKELLNELGNKIDLKGSFSKTIVTKDDGKVRTCVSYKVNIDDSTDITKLQSLEDINFDGLEDTLKEFVITLKNSPKIQELAESLKELEKRAKKD